MILGIIGVQGALALLRKACRPRAANAPLLATLVFKSAGDGS
jgi:hypothetical protein